MKLFQIIIPVFQTKNMFLLCINSLIETLTYPTELIIINDNSPFSCKELILQEEEIPKILNIKYVEHSFCHGFAKSINEGLDYVTDARYVIFADSDIIFTAGWQDAVITTLQDCSVGAVSGVFLYPQSEGIQCCGIAYQNYLARHIYLNNKISQLSLAPIFDVQSTIFAFLAVKNDIVKKIGKLDEHFFNGYEDVDYQFRIRQNGYRIVTNTNMQFYHFEKSNGIHRQYQRKQNLGVFWAKHSSEVKNDLINFLQIQLEARKQLSKHFVLINMSEAPNDANIIIEFLKTKLSIDTVLNLSNECSIEQKIWLSELLSSDSYALPKPYILLCDNFVQLTENAYWFKLRSQYNEKDMIIDLCANVIPFTALCGECWPGNKIR